MLTPALAAAGFNVQLRLRDVGPEDAEADLVVVLGGPMGVFESQKFPFLADEIALLRQRLRSNRATLGICLGAQLLASAAGARVYPGRSGFELGVHSVQLTEAGRRDPLLRAAPPNWIVAHWHGDTFDAVPGGTHLALNERYEYQGFRLGNSWGFQFHPELDAETLTRWLEEVPEDISRAGKNVAEIIRTEVPRLRAAEPLNAKLLASWFQEISKTKR